MQVLRYSTELQGYNELIHHKFMMFTYKQDFHLGTERVSKLEDPLFGLNKQSYFLFMNFLYSPNYKCDL